MDAVTTEPKHAQPQSQRQLPAQDPDHDIDAKKTVSALVACTVFVFASVWVLHIVFGRVVFQERQQKIDLAPTAELDALHSQEQAELSTNGGIEAAMQDYVEQRSR